MTPDRLVEFIPSTLEWLHPDPMPETAGDVAAICGWLQKIRESGSGVATHQNGTEVPIGFPDDAWPPAPKIKATYCGLGHAITAPQLKIAASIPVSFCNYAGHNQRGDYLPTLSNSAQVAGHVIASTGELAFSRNDFTLTGPFPFHWKRHYRQGVDEDLGLGPGWRHSLSEKLQLPDASPGAAQKVLLHAADGRLLAFDLPAIGHASFNRSERIYLLRQSLHSFRVSTFNEPDKIFRADGTGKTAPLCEVRDDYGNTLSVDYHNGRLEKIVTSWGTTLECHYESGHLVSVINTRGGDGLSLCDYSYNSDGCLVATRSTLGQESFTIRAGQITSLTNLDIGHLKFAYDKLQRVNAIYLSEEAAHEPVANDHRQMSWQLRWRSGTRTCIVSSSDRYDMHWRFDSRGNLVEASQRGRVQRWRYDLYRNLCHRVDARGKSTLYRHDEFGRILRRSRDDLHSCYLYDDEGRLTVAGDIVDKSLARCWQYRYAGNAYHPGTIIDPEKNQWKCEHDERGQLRVLTDPEEGRTTFAWNAQCQLIGLAHGEQTFTWDYDGNGNITRHTCAGQTHREWHYDKHGKLSWAVFGDHTFSITPDEYGRPCTLSCDQEVLLQWQYDGHGRVLRIQEDSMPALTLGYNRNGQLISLDSSDQHCSWHYNHYGQLVNFQDGDALKREWLYEAGGQLREFRDSDSYWYLQYDKRGQLEQIRNNSGQHCSFHFDLLGRLTQAANEQCNLRYRYDKRDLLIAEHHDINSESTPENLSINHNYDRRGWLKSSCSDSIKIAYLFSAAGKLYGIDTNGAMAVRSELQYDDSNSDEGRLSERLSLGPQQIEKIYQRGMLKSISHGRNLVWHNQNEKQTPKELLPRLALHSAHPASATGERDAHNNLVADIRVSANATTEYRYQYDGWGRLYCVECADFKTWLRSDPFGRRLLKTSTHRRAGRQRRIAMHWSGIGLWSEITHLDDKRMGTHFLHHPIDGTALARLELGDPGDRNVSDGEITRRVFFVADESGRLLALLPDTDTAANPVDGPKPLWLFEPDPKIPNQPPALCPGGFQGSLGIYDNETQLFYRDFRYFIPVVNRGNGPSRLEPGTPLEGGLGYFTNAPLEQPPFSIGHSQRESNGEPRVVSGSARDHSRKAVSEP